MSAITTTQTDETVPLARAARRKLGPMLTTGLVLLVLLVLVAIFVPVFLGEQAGSLTEHRRQHASSEHILGTDEFGRDLLARALVATRLTLILTTAATGIGVILGVVVGLFVWLVPKHVRNFVLGANAVAVAFPGLVLALVIASILGTGAVPATIAVGAASIPAFVRLSARYGWLPHGARLCLHRKAVERAEAKVLVSPRATEPRRALADTQHQQLRSHPH